VARKLFECGRSTRVESGQAIPGQLCRGILLRRHISGGVFNN
jgi:hypothetical protein